MTKSRPKRPFKRKGVVKTNHRTAILPPTMAPGSVKKRTFWRTLNLSKAFYISFGITFLFAICVVFFYYPKADKLYAEIKMNDDVSMSFGTNQFYADSVDNRISPLCGCFLVRPHRGIQFFSKEIKLTIADTAFNKPDAINEFNFFSPFDNMGFNPMMEFSVRFLIIKKAGYSNGRKIGFSSVLTAKEKRYVNYDTTVNHVENLSLLVKSNQLSVIPSKFAAASIIPIKDSKIKIIKHRQPYNRTDYSVTLTEDYNTSGAQTGQWETPTLDVFGPEVKVYSELGILKINGDIYLKNALNDSTSNLLMIFNIMPHLRMVHTKLPHKLLNNSLKPENNIMYYDTKGQMKIESAIMSDDDFRELKKQYQKNPVLNISKTIIGKSGNVLNWAAPSITGCNGIYIYSADISSLSSSETTGGITYGVEGHNLYPMKNVAFKNLKNFKTYNEPLVIPLSDSCNETIKFHAVGDLWFNGNERVSFNSLKNSVWVLLQVVSCVITIILFTKDFIVSLANKPK